jgi:hypothetical protein
MVHDAMSRRTPPPEREDDALHALELAVAAAGFSTSPPAPDAMRADLVVTAPDGRSFEIKITATSVATAEQVDRIRHWRGEGVVPILVADEVPAAVRRDLDDGNVSWLDRRGHLRLTAPGLFVDAAVPATP